MIWSDNFKNKFQQKKKNMLNQIVVSYTIVMICIISIFSLALYYIVRSQINQRVAEANLSILNQAVAWTDYSLQSLENRVASISSETFVSDFAALNYDGDRHMTVEELDAFQNITKQLLNTFADSGMIQSTLLYTYSNQMAISTDGTVYPGYETRKMNWVSDLDRRFQQDGWYIYEEDNKNTYDIGGDNPKKELYVSLVRKIPMFMPNPLGAVIVKVPASRIQENITNAMQLDGGALMIVDNDNRILFHSNSEYIGKNVQNVYTELSEKMQAAYSNDHFMIGKLFDKQAALVCKSNYTSWRYVVMGKRNLLTSNFIGWGALLWLITAVIIFICLFVIRKISLKIYSPVQNVANIAAKLKGGTQAFQENEMQIIADALHNIDNERNKLNRIVRENKLVMKERFVKNLISGTQMSLSSIKQQGSWLEVSLDKKWFLVIVWIIDYYDSFCSQYNQYDQTMMKFGVCNISEEVLDSCGECISCDLGENKIVSVLNSDQEESIDHLNEKLCKIQSYVKNYLDISLSAGYSIAMEGVSSISKGFQLAQEAADERFLLGHSCIAAWKPSDRDQTQTLKLDARKISNMIKSGDRKGIGVEVHEFTNQIKNTHEFRVDIVWMAILELLQALSENPGFKIENILNDAKRGQNFETVDMVGSWLEALLERIMVLKENEAGNSGTAQRHMERALCCINENYNQDISLQWVGEKLGLSPQYISALFRQEYGDTFLSYLNKVRIEAAKQLLSEGNENVSFQVIGEMVGFNSVHTFMRVFKKYEGITPGKYREMMNK